MAASSIELGNQQGKTFHLPVTPLESIIPIQPGPLVLPLRILPENRSPPHCILAVIIGHQPSSQRRKQGNDSHAQRKHATFPKRLHLLLPVGIDSIGNRQHHQHYQQIICDLLMGIHDMHPREHQCQQSAPEIFSFEAEYHASQNRRHRGHRPTLVDMAGIDNHYIISSKCISYRPYYRKPRCTSQHTEQDIHSNHVEKKNPCVQNRQASHHHTGEKLVVEVSPFRSHGRHPAKGDIAPIRPLSRLFITKPCLLMGTIPAMHIPLPHILLA